MQGLAWTLLWICVVTLNFWEVRGRSVSVAHHITSVSQAHNLTRGHLQQHTYHGSKGHTNVQNKSSTSRRRRVHAKKTSTWKTITDTLTQMVLGDDDDDYDSSSNSDSRSESDSAPDHPIEHPKKSRWRALASSAFAGLAPRIWARLTSNKGKKPSKKRKRFFRMTTPLSLQPEEANEGNAVDPQPVPETNKKVPEDKAVNGRHFEKTITNGLHNNNFHPVEEGLIAREIHKFVARRENLALIEQAVADSGRRLSFIEYAAILEIMVLSVIAAGVFRSATLPVPVSVFAKV